MNFLRQVERSGATWDPSHSKCRMLMTTLLAKYTRQHIATLTESEYQEIFKEYCELQLESALAAIAETSKYSEKSFLISMCKYYARSGLASIEQFPDKS